MKASLLILLAICTSSFGFSMTNSGDFKSENEIALCHNKQSTCRFLEMPPESCVQIAIAGINQAYANYDNMLNVCANIHTTGQGFLDCARYARRVRELQIAMTYLQLGNCDDSIPGTTV
ncbi:MAG: hypothetical protein V9E88_11635 [Ferruginibacter sp.]